jgi:ornithine carbamoyltransferase
MKHLLSLEGLSREDIQGILQSATLFKRERGHHARLPLTGQVWALIFSKSSTRTRVSFEVGIRELGGAAVFLSVNDIQLGRGEPVKDTARVLGRMVHGAIIRTFAQRDVEEFARYAGVPTINALTDEEHPCQILADMFTYQEKRGPIQGKVVAFIGDGASNVATSWVCAAARFGFELRVASPATYKPADALLQRLGRHELLVAGSGSSRADRFQYESGGSVARLVDPAAAARGADLLYTDVWVSMGKEAESAERCAELSGYQINQALVSVAKPDALVMHCLPAYRGKEIDEPTFEAHAQTIFDQAENRLHVQKAILSLLAG